MDFLDWLAVIGFVLSAYLSISKIRSSLIKIKNGYTPIDINGVVFTDTDYKQKEILLLNTLSVAMRKNINDSAIITMGKQMMDYLEDKKYIFTENVHDSNLNSRYIDRSDIVESIKRHILLYVNVLEPELPF